MQSEAGLRSLAEEGTCAQDLRVGAVEWLRNSDLGTVSTHSVPYSFSGALDKPGLKERHLESQLATVS